MNRSRLLVIVIAVLVVATGVAAVWPLLRPGGPPLVSAALEDAAITPNGDRTSDLTHIVYALRRPATVSIYFENASGQRFYFREDSYRDAGDYRVEFNGVVTAFSLPTDDFAAMIAGSDAANDLDALGDLPPDLTSLFTGQVLRRVLPEGDYTWFITATDDGGQVNTLSGPLNVSAVDDALPLVVNFQVSPTRFSPNRDGIDDRAAITLALTKDLPADGLHVYLIAPDGTRLPIEEQPGKRQPGEAGVHNFEYDAGIDQNLTPPVDGAYTVLAETEDELGQRVEVTTQLAITNGGLPRAEIVRADVAWSSNSVVIGGVLSFTLVVENYGTAPLRTTGPEPGFQYESMSINANALGAYEESGAWRIGLMCQTCKTDYPWRWAIGKREDLTLIPDSNNRPQYYLMPGEKSVVTGSIVLDEVVPSLNPQYFWAGLIQENVAVVNNRIDQNLITILAP